MTCNFYTYSPSRTVLMHASTHQGNAQDNISAVAWASVKCTLISNPLSVLRSQVLYSVPMHKIPPVFAILIFSLFVYMSPKITLAYTTAYSLYFGLPKVFGQRSNPTQRKREE